MAERKRKSLLALLLLLGAGFFLFLALFWPHSSSHQDKKIRAASPEAEKLINKHLWMTSSQKELSQEKMKAQNAFLAPQVGEAIWPKKTAGQLGVDHSPDSNETNAYEDLNRYRKDLQATNPDSIIQGQIADQQREQEYTEAYRQEYARQFVENAKRNGYQVRLNSDFVVISVRPISKPQNRNPSLFEQSSRMQAK